MKRAKIIKNLKRIRGVLSTMQQAPVTEDENIALTQLWVDTVALIRKMQIIEAEGELTNVASPPPPA